ncbi:unnamed protein product [Coffea canephora]|uniref:Protein kinase domain-containing protein n=1 Tax=Coffea canephora TaxID=49390 RepID=A0A068UKW0_COFCA|nr:unnamed protein product [Coffea canephora]
MLAKEETSTLTNTLATIGYIAPEYGFEGLVSTKCDVYSFGIMLMEVFTRRRPSDDMFVGNLSLKSWISGSMPYAIFQVVDANLFEPHDEHFTVKLECLSSIMEVALICAAESPVERLCMEDVSNSLKKIKLKFLSRHGER